MRTLIMVPRSLSLEKRSAVPRSAVQHHLGIEEAAAFVSGNISRGERELAIAHLADCGQCRKMIAEICHSEETVKDVGDPSQ